MNAVNTLLSTDTYLLSRYNVDVCINIHDASLYHRYWSKGRDRKLHGR